MIPACLGRYGGHRVWSADDKALRQVHAYVTVYNSLAQALKQLTSCCPIMALHGINYLQWHSHNTALFVQEYTSNYWCI